MSRTGFIGLGIMGNPMAKNLLEAGYPLVVYDIIQSSVNDLVTLGAAPAGSPKDIAASCKTILLMLPNGPEVRQVMTGADGLLESIQPGTVIIDLSSVSPAVSTEMYGLCKKKKVSFMDAPVSGGEPKAIDGTLAIMVGCDAGDFKPQVPLLMCMGASVVRTGEIGSGNVTKLVNQVIVALNIAALSEAMVLGTKAGVDPQIIFDAIKGGLAGSAVMNAKIPKILERNFKPGFKIDLHIKDLANVLETSRLIGVPMPLTSLVMEIMQTLRVEGKGQNDHGGIVQFFEKLAQTEVIRMN